MVSVFQSAAAAPHASGSKSYLPSLDGLRAIAVLLVMMAHLPKDAAGQLHRAVPQLMHLGGYLGVDLFFMLSGFLITRILLAERAAGSPLRFFLMRRCLRIFPLYYLVLALNAVFAPSVAIAWCAAYLSNFYFAFHVDDNLLRHTWSLCVEEHFYLFWPLLVFNLSPRASFRALCGLMALSLVSSALLVFLRMPHASSLIYAGTQSRVWSLALGAVVAYTPVGIGEPPQARHAALMLALGGGLALGAVGLAASGRGPEAYLAMLPGYSFLSLAALLLSLAPGAPGLGSLLCARPLRFLGRISYGLYLFHPFTYRLCMQAHGERLSWNLVGRAALGATLAVAAATLSFEYFESYFLRLKSRFIVVAPASDATASGGGVATS